MFKKSAVSALVFSTLALAASAQGAVVTAGDRRAPPGFVIDFISIGAGINNEAYAFVQQRLGEALAQDNLREFTLTPWGREGERKVCFVLGGAGDAWTLVQALQASGLSDGLVHVEGTASCKVASR